MTTDTQAGNGQDSESADQQEATKSIHHPHDKFAKVVLGTADRAKDFHNIFGPEETAGNIKTVRRKSSLLIASDLSSSEADLLYDVTTVNGLPPEFISMIELKSCNDPSAMLQMHGYLNKILLDWAEGKAERLRSLIPIVVTLLHSGDQPWNESLSLRGATPFSDLLGKWPPEFFYHPVDLAVLPAERLLQAGPDLASGLLALKFSGQEDLDITKEYTRIIRLLPPGSDLLMPLRHYVFDTTAESCIHDVSEVFRKEMPVDWENTMRTHGEVLRAEGEARGVAKGKAEGKAEGKAGALTLLLETRFGGLPEEARDMIGTADESQLDRWVVKAASAPTLDAVINGHDAS